MSRLAIVRPTVLAIVVVLSLVVPFTGQADPIVEPPKTELLVEGHTVYMTIEAYQYEPSDATPMAPAHAFAPDVLEPEPVADALVRVKRNPGVLWFNDHYAVNPWSTTTTGLGTGSTVESSYGAMMAMLVRADDGRIREPCGGAFLVVNEGDPDPRSLLLSLDGTDLLTGQSGAADGPAALGIDTQNAEVHSEYLPGQVDAIVGTGFGYWHSYVLTDPNDHHWIVDKYLGTSRVRLPSGEITTYSYPVWVSNVLGGPVFHPDVDFSLDESTCLPAKGLFDEIGAPLSGMLCGVNLPLGPGGSGNDTEITFNPYNGNPAWTDDPCMGYEEPSRNGFCYGGQPAPFWPDYCMHDAPNDPLRRYHGLMYFAWEDLLVPGEAMDHCTYDPTLVDWTGALGGCNPALNPATAGCQSGTEWPCPGEAPWEDLGMDDLEGFSHASHPTAPPHEEAEPCVPLANAINPTNHGGSPSGRSGRCDYRHATAKVDVYFSGAGRPPEPLVRFFELIDLEGSSAPFYDFHASYPGVP